MAGNTQATAPATADSPNKGDASAVGTRQAQTDHRPPTPDRESSFMESLDADLGEEVKPEGKDKATAKEGKDKTGSPGGKAEGGRRKAEGDKPKAGSGSKKLNLGDDDDDEDGDGTASEEEDEEEQEVLKKAAKAKLDEESGDDEESEEEEEEEQEQEQEQESEAEEEDDDEEKETKDKAKKTGSAGSKKPKGMEDWPDAAVERFERQDRQVKELKKQLAIEGVTIAPTPDSPFAHIEKAEDLETLIGQAKAWRKQCQAIPEGGEVKLGNGKTKELSKEEVQQRLNWAEGILDVDAVSEARERLNHRATHKPWEEAQRLVPDLFDRKSENFKTFASLLQQVPQLRKLDDYEYFVACALKGLQQDGEEKSGAARYVKVDMKDGKPVVAKKAKAGQETGKKKTPSPAPNDTRSPLKSKSPGKADVGAAEKRYQGTRSDDDFAKLVAADIAA